MGRWIGGDSRRDGGVLGFKRRCGGKSPSTARAVPLPIAARRGGDKKAHAFAARVAVGDGRAGGAPGARPGVLKVYRFGFASTLRAGGFPEACVRWPCSGLTAAPPAGRGRRATPSWNGPSIPLDPGRDPSSGSHRHHAGAYARDAVARGLRPEGFATRNATRADPTQSPLRPLPPPFGRRPTSPPCDGTGRP